MKKNSIFLPPKMPNFMKKFNKRPHRGAWGAFLGSYGTSENSKTVGETLPPTPPPRNFGRKNDTPGGIIWGRVDYYFWGYEVEIWGVYYLRVCYLGKVFKLKKRPPKKHLLTYFPDLPCFCQFMHCMLIMPQFFGPLNLPK